MVRENLLEIALYHPAATFRRAAERFLDKQPWLVHDGGTKWKMGYHNVWKMFVDNFDIYLRLADEKAERDRKSREREQAGPEQTAIQKRNDRWREYLLAAVPEYERMSDEDRKHAATVRAEIESEPKDVSDAEIKESIGVYGRHKHYVRDREAEERERRRSLLNERSRQLFAKLRRAAEWAQRFEADQKRIFLQKIQEFQAWIDSAKTVEQLQDECALEELLSDLDPNSNAEAAAQGALDALFGSDRAF